jgi:hypothetical protein
MAAWRGGSDRLTLYKTSENPIPVLFSLLSISGFVHVFNPLILLFPFVISRDQIGL